MTNPKLDKLDKIVPGVEYDINKRWETGAKHHPKSIALFKRIAEIDFNLCGDFFHWKDGGDGDNGETLMYEMDIYFEEQAAAPREFSSYTFFIGTEVK